MGEAKRKKVAKAAGVEMPAAAKSETIHRKTFMGGRETPTDVHRRLGVAQKCFGCGAPGAIVIRVFVEKKELFDKNPDMAALIMANSPDGMIPTAKMIYGDMVRVSQKAFCTACSPAAERAAADAPDWALVEISRGPIEKTVVSVPRSYVVEKAVKDAGFQTQ